jgi:hypothetical protein
MLNHERPQPMAGGAVDGSGRDHSTALVSIEQKSLAEVLAKLEPLLFRLAAALDRQTQPAPKLAYREREVARLFGVSVTHWQRAVHRGEAPQADLRMGQIKLCSHDRITAWIQAGGRQ